MVDALYTEGVNHSGAQKEQPARVGSRAGSWRACRLWAT